MYFFKKTVKSTSILLIIVLFLASTSHQTVSAAMVGTEKLLQAENIQDKRDYLLRLMEREEVKRALIGRGIDPLEAQLRIQSLTDEEVQSIAGKLDDLSAGGGVEIFSLIVIAFVIATVLIFKFTSITDVFP